MRGDQMARQWKIIQFVESHRNGISVADLAEKTDSLPRTVYRDLDALLEGGFPLYTDKDGKNSLWKMMDTYKGFPVPMTRTELMALYMSRDLLRIFEGMIFQESIETLFEKVKAALLPETIQFIEKVAGSVQIDLGPTKNLSGFNEIVKDLSEAATSRKRVEIDYRAVSTGKLTAQRKVDPYKVWIMNCARSRPAV